MNKIQKVFNLYLFNFSICGLYLITSIAYADVPQSIKGQWREVDSIQKIRIFTSESTVPNLLAFRGETIIDATTAQVASALLDQNSRREWLADYGDLKSYPIKKNPLEIIEAFQADLPWPFSNRLLLYQAQFQSSVGGQIVNIIYNHLSPSMVQHLKDVPNLEIEAHIYHYHYILEGIDGDKKTKVTLEMMIDFVGNVPRWISNLLQRSWLALNLDGLKRAAPMISIVPDEIKDTLQL